MASVAQNLQTAKEGFALQLANISANPKPSYTVDGRNYNWTEYLTFLLNSMKTIDAQISQEEGWSDVVIQGGT